MLLLDALVRPASGPVELGHQRLGVFDAYLVDPVLVAVQCQQSAVAAVVHALHGIEYVLGTEPGEGAGLIGIRHPGLPAPGVFFRASSSSQRS